MDRRRFLKLVGIGGGAALLTPWGALRAEKGATARSYVFAYFSGGWDILVSLDPRDPNKFTDAAAGTTRIQPAYDRLPNGFPRSIVQPAGSRIDFGPAIGNFAKHYDKSCVVRGVNMDTVTHAIGRRYFLTGKKPLGLSPNGSSLGTRIVAQQGDNSPVPNLVSRVETYNADDPAFASGLLLASVADLTSTFTDGKDAPGNEVRAALSEYRRTAKNCDPTGLDTSGLLSSVRGAQSKARQLVDSGLSKHFDFKAAAQADLVQRYNVGESLTTGQAQAAMAYQALKHNVAQCITIQLARGLDTHNSNWATLQAPRQRAGWNTLATLVDDLASTPDTVRGGKLLDHTTIMCFSEFGRTPLLNNSGGRDHSVSSAVLLCGAGVPTNRVVGGTADVGLNPMGIDPQSGEARENATQRVTPSNVVASIMSSAGYNVDALRAAPLPCLMKS